MAKKLATVDWEIDSEMTPELSAYFFLTFLLVITPGAATAVVLRNTTNGGFRRSAATALGAASGNSVIAATTRLGLMLVLERWPIALAILKWVARSIESERPRWIA